MQFTTSNTHEQSTTRDRHKGFFSESRSQKGRTKRRELVGAVVACASAARPHARSSAATRGDAAGWDDGTRRVRTFKGITHSTVLKNSSAQVQLFSSHPTPSPPPPTLTAVLKVHHIQGFFSQFRGIRNLAKFSKILATLVEFTQTFEESKNEQQ